ncbi:hypothetical protein COCON_G00002970 [Conger conger]|uniref:Uncharacterized protein n=1 Tax=Conger conger TaxID=82655 RepID=A0A9Q1I8E8_CONCO|nr:hypothetical protein COCON_G00002970 [Conger conger]
MICFQVQFCSVLYLTLVGPALSRVWVNHWATQDQYRVGDNATLHCTIFSDKETIGYCNTDWVMPNPNKPGGTVDITESELYAGRVTVLDNDNTTTQL